MALQKEKCTREKMSMEILAIFLCVNMTDELKKKTVTTVKSAKPRRLKEIEANKLNVEWYSNTWAWMQGK